MKLFMLLLVCGFTAAIEDILVDKQNTSTPLTSDLSTTPATTTSKTTESTTSKLPNVQITRTALHVARSLDPESMETVNVRTRDGDIATLIVRKRGGKSNLAIPAPVSVRSSSINIEDEREGKSHGLPPSVSVKSSSFMVDDEDQRNGKHVADVINIVAPPKDLSPPSSLEQLVRQFSENNKREEKNIRVPPPVFIRSSPMAVKGQQEVSNDFWKRGRSVMHIDSDGIPVIHGVRMPDDESDKQTWRNARVINGVLVPYDKPNTQDDSGDKQEITRKATVHLEDPATKKNTPEDSSQFRPSTHLEHTVKKKQHNYNFPYASDTHARILEYINTVNQRETDRRNKSQIRARNIRFPASRRSDEDVDEVPELRRSFGNAESEGRVLQYPGSSIYPTSLLYTPSSQKTSRVSFEEGVRTPVLQYAHPELGVQPAKVMRKQDEGEETEEVQQETKKGEASKGNSLTLAYFAQDIHSDRSPYAYEPGMEADEEQTESTGTEASTYDKRSSSNDLSAESTTSQNWPKNSVAYLHQQTAEDTYGLGNDKYIKRFPYNGYNNVYNGPSKDSQNRFKNSFGGSSYSRYPYGGHYAVHTHSYQERPFWERIGDTIREHVQTSMEKVTDITRPVVEPLVEATHKISHNLGFAVEGNRNVIQDKVGSTVAAYPVLLPALGLVAGGAALGLGAVAVGRYLDVDVMKRRIGVDSSEDLEVEHKRALEKILKSLGRNENPREEGTWVVAEEFKNPDEQKKVLDSAVRTLHEEHGSGDQDDVQRKAMEEIVKTLRDKHNARQGQWIVANNPVKQDEVKMIANVIQNLKDKPRDSREEGTWFLVKNYNEDNKVQNTFGRQAIWSRSDEVGNQEEDQEKKTIESIVGTLAGQEGISHRDGSWIVTEESTQNEDQSRKQGAWLMNKGIITADKGELKPKRSTNEGIFLVVEEDPKVQTRQQFVIPRIAISDTRFRKERDISSTTGDKFSHQPLSDRFEIIDSIAYQPHTVKRFAEEPQKLSNFEQSNYQQHVISKRSADQYHSSDRREEEIYRMEGGDQYLDNILHSLESSQQEILANMARLDDRHRNDWSNTPCAKKIFCDVMVKQPADAVMLMEKKMATFLSLIQPNEAVSYHLSDVMEAVKRHDCSTFKCPSAVDPSRVDTPTRGPGPRR